MGALIDLKGKVFGSLRVNCRSYDRIRPSGSRVPMWWCTCVCGKIVEVEGGDLRRRTTVTCGCHSGFASGHKNRKHGKSKTKEYSIWLGMHRRCYDSRDKYYACYGGRGIKICERWLQSNKRGLSNFMEDMGPIPGRSYSIERINVNGNYSPDNCAWIPASDQAKNKTNSRRLAYRDVTMIQSDWAKIFGIYPAKIQYHMKTGKTFTQTIAFLLERHRKKLDVDSYVSLMGGDTGIAFCC